MRIREIIGQTSSDVDTTINIVQFKNKPNTLKQIMNTIITPSFERALKESLEPMMDQIIRTGNVPDFQSFLYEGLFGVGKTHLLSVLNTLFDETIDPSIRAGLWQRIIEIFGDVYSDLKEKKFLVVPLALHGSLQADLIDIIFREIEKIVLERFEIEVNLSSPSKYIHYFNKVCAPGNKKDIQDMISSEFDDMNLEKFNVLDEEEDVDYYRKAEIIRKSMKKLGLKLDDSYMIGDSIEEFIQIVLEQSFKQLKKQVINRDEIDYDGIIILIDEFSEFLKAHEHGSERTLASLQIQFLAEYIKGKDFFVFLAAQQEWLTLDPLLKKQVGSGGRLKKIPLDHYNFVEIFNQVLTPEKANYRGNIDSLFPTLKAQFFGDSQYSIYKPNEPAAINNEIFFLCYPFHPKTMDLLIDHVFKLSTQARAGLSYASYHIEESLDNDIEELITPDTLFDYFKKEIKKDTKKYNFIKELIQKVQSDTENFSDSEKRVISKVLKYIYLTENHVYADDCIIDLLLNYDDDKELEDLLNRLIEFSKREDQISYLKKILDRDTNKQKYYLQVKETYDIEDMVHFLSQEINDTDLHEYYVDNVFDIKLGIGAEHDIKIKNKDWQFIEYFIKFEDFNEALNEVAGFIVDLPKWTPKRIDFYDMFVFWNLPFREEFDNFTPSEIREYIQEYEADNEKLEDRLLFFRVGPFSEVVISEIKRCLAFDLLNRRFRSLDPNWQGDGDIQQKILVRNDRLFRQLNSYYNENLQDNREDILIELSTRQHEYSLERGSSTYIKIIDHYSENFSVINNTGAIDIGGGDKRDILEEKMEDIVNKYYPDFPEFLANTDYTRHINEILGELGKDQKTFEIPSRRLNQLKGTAITQIGVILGIFSEVETKPSGNKIFKIYISEDNILYSQVMGMIPMEEEIDERRAEMISLSKICENLYEKVGFSLNISRILLATLLNQDKIKVTNRNRTAGFNNLQVKKVFEDNVRNFYSLYVFKTKKLTRDEINWLFHFFNGLFENDEEDEYRTEFKEEIDNIDEIDDVKSSKQQRLKDLLENINLDEIDTFHTEINDLINSINRGEDE